MPTEASGLEDEALEFFLQIARSNLGVNLMGCRFKEDDGMVLPHT